LAKTTRLDKSTYSSKYSRLSYRKCNNRVSIENKEIISWVVEINYLTSIDYRSRLSIAKETDSIAKRKF
jgi:hypothetical protein